jgi:uncharacterized protein (DUF736 family)
MENTNTNSDKPKLEEAGALWKRTSKSGNTYLNGTVKTKNGDTISVLVFSNAHKVDGSNQPDYRIYFDTPRENGSTQVTQKKSTAASDEIPF